MMCKSAVLSMYNHIIEDVILEMRDIFFDEGVDEQILKDLKTLWESKLNANKSVHNNEARNMQSVLDNKKDTPQQQTESEDKIVPFEITIPVQPNNDSLTRVFKIYVPESAVHSRELNNLLTDPIITAVMSLPAHLAASILEKHVKAALKSHQQQIISKDKNTIEMTPQVDGVTDTSDEDDDISNDILEDIDEELQKHEHNSEDESLNSEDDVTDEESSDLFTTDNVVVCQYDKICRIKNKWKFYLKHGIMNLNGEDFIFHSASGDANW